MSVTRAFADRRRHAQNWLGQGAPIRFAVVVAVLIAAAYLGKSASLLVLGLLVAVGGGLLLLRDLRWGLIALPVVALLVPFQIGTGTEVAINAAVLIVPALVAVWLLRGLMQGQIHFVSSRLNRPLLAFLLVMLVSWLRGNAMWEATVPRPANANLVQLGQMSIYILSFASFWLMANLVTSIASLRKIAYSFVLSIGSVVCLGTLLHALPGLRSMLPGNVLLNLTTVWLVSLSVSLAIYDQDLRPGVRSLMWLIAAITVGAIVLIWFKEQQWIGGWMPPFIAMVLILWFAAPRWRILIVAVIIVFLVVGGLDLLSQAVNLEEEWQTSGDSRVTIWRSVMELANRSPLFGLGIVAYRYYHYIKPLVYGHTIWLSPHVSAHNMFLDLYAQMGILGLACYIWFLFEILLLAWSSFKRYTGFAKGYALAAIGAVSGGIAADMLAETTLPFVYNMGFSGFRASVVAWMLLGGLVVLENTSPQAMTASDQND